jgi:hypothetical protein
MLPVELEGATRTMFALLPDILHRLRTYDVAYLATNILLDQQFDSLVFSGPILVSQTEPLGQFH